MSKENVKEKAKLVAGLGWVPDIKTDPEARVGFPALPDFLRSSGSETGSTQPREYNSGAAGKKK
jgi:hypothetical protein